MVTEKKFKKPSTAYGKLLFQTKKSIKSGVSTKNRMSVDSTARKVNFYAEEVIIK